MRKIINLAFRHPLISGSTVIFFGSMTANILNYVFNLGTGRLLSHSDYGTLISLVSVFNIFSVFSITISTVFAKFSAVYVGQKKEQLLLPLFVSGSMWIGIISVFVAMIMIIFSLQISQFLNISSVFLVNIVALSLFFSYLSSVGVGILQGLLKFGYYSFINIFSSLVKLALGMFLIFFGLKVLGGIAAFFISILVAYLLTLPPIYRLMKRKSGSLSIQNLFSKLSLYGLPVFLSNIGITAFITIDIILVKHFFDPAVAGQYSAISIMGRSIFFVVSPIMLVLFPLVAQKKERKEDLTGIVLLSLFLVAVPAVLLSFIYFIFPEIVRNVFYPSYQARLLNPYLGQFSIFILFYAFIYLLNLFYLSIGKTKVYILTILGSVLEIVLIYFFHKDIGQIINSLITSSFLLLVSLLLYLPKATKDSKD